MFDREKKLTQLHRRQARLRQEEAKLGRLFITGNIGEDAYKQLRIEWQDKVRHVEMQLADVERETSQHINNLDVALMLLSHLPELFNRLESKRRATLLQMLASRIYSK